MHAQCKGAPKVTLTKTSAMVCNEGGGEWAHCFSGIGMKVKDFVNYLAVRLGNVLTHCIGGLWGLTPDKAARSKKCSGGHA